MNATISNLPALPSIVYEVMRSIESNQPVEVIAQTISCNTQLENELLNLANSTLYGLSGMIKSVKNAISVIGLEVLHGIVLSHGVKSSLKSDISLYGTTYEQFYSVIVLQDELINQWCNNRYEELRQPLTSLTLVSDIGKIGFAKCLSSKIELDYRLLQNAKTFQELQNAEKRLLGLTSEETSALMLQQWQIHKDVIDILRYYGDNSLVLDARKKKIFQMHCVVKTCINIKQNYQKDEIKKASQKAKEYGLEGFDESIFIAL